MKLHQTGHRLTATPTGPTADRYLPLHLWYKIAAPPSWLSHDARWAKLPSAWRRWYKHSPTTKPTTASMTHEDVGFQQASGRMHAERQIS